mmetsp:Transcript_52534/g.127243  ORF Transcript_52534/g.127243 Transcript_52534/m.127243 type:complete len:125 (-) Transcript_52534:438-812(-)
MIFRSNGPFLYNYLPSCPVSKYQSVKKRAFYPKCSSVIKNRSLHALVHCRRCFLSASASLASLSALSTVLNRQDNKQPAAAIKRPPIVFMQKCIPSTFTILRLQLQVCTGTGAMQDCAILGGWK